MVGLWRSGSLLAVSLITLMPFLLAAGPGACERPRTAGPDGAFTVQGVEPPYDVAAVAPGAAEVTVYLGVSRADPTVALAELGGPLYSARVAGLVSGGSPLPPSGRIRTRVAFGSRAGVASADAGIGTADYELTVGWNGGATTSGELRALRWEYDPAGLPIAYLGLAPGGPLSLGAGDDPRRDLELQPVETRSISGRVAAPWPVALKLPEVAFGDGPGMDLAEDWSESETFDYAVPAAPGASLRVWACAFGPAGDYAAGQVAGMPPGSGGVLLDLPPPPVLLQPDDGAAEVDGTTRFAWTRFSGLHAVHLRGPAGARPTRCSPARPRRACRTSPHSGWLRGRTPSTAGRSSVPPCSPTSTISPAPRSSGTSASASRRR